MRDTLQILAAWVIATLAVERIVEIWIHGDIFMERRQAIGKWYAIGSDSGMRWFFYKILTCAWCLSVWVSLLCSLSLPGSWFQLSAADNIVTKWFALVGLANFWHAIARWPLLFEIKLFNGRVDTHAIMDQDIDSLLTEEVDDV